MALEITCPAPCAFRVRNENESELVYLTQHHLKNTHNKEMTREEILKIAKKV
jgi:predicted small metal-binding protein